MVNVLQGMQNVTRCAKHETSKPRSSRGKWAIRLPGGQGVAGSSLFAGITSPRTDETSERRFHATRGALLRHDSIGGELLDPVASVAESDSPLRDRALRQRSATALTGPPLGRHWRTLALVPSAWSDTSARDYERTATRRESSLWRSLCSWGISP